MKRSRLAIIVVGVLALATLVPVTAGAAPLPAGGPKSSDPVKVGQIIPATNSAGGVAFPTVKEAMQASVKAFNKRGGLNGRKIELVLCDTKGDPNTEANCARRMVSEGVVATLDDWALFNTAATAKILEDAGIARIGINLADPSEFGSPVSFPLTSDPIGGGVGQAVGLAEAGNEKLAIVIVETPSASIITDLIQPAAKGEGSEIVTLVQIPPGATDYSQYVAAAQQDGADAYMLGLDAPSAIQFMRAMQQLNDTTQLGLVSGVFTLNDLKEYASLTKKAVFADAFPNVTSSPKEFPFITQYRKDMKAGGLDVAELDSEGVAAWGSLLALVTIMEGETTVDPASTMAAVRAAQNVDMQGVIPPWTPSASGESPLLPSVANPIVYLQTFNGKAVKTKVPGLNVFTALSAGT